MNTPAQTVPGSPPKLIGSIATGFNVVASHIGLILLPVAVDFYLWLGPHVRIDNLLSPMIADMQQVFQQYYSADMSARMQEVANIWNTQISSFNLLSLVHTFPIGIPSLMSSATSTDTPFGGALVMNAVSGLAAFALSCLFLAIGFALGCVYFNQIARATAEENQPFELKVFFAQSLQALGLTISLVLAVMILIFPVLVVMAVFAMISASMADLAMLFLLFIALWILIPMMFTPHSIFSQNKNLVVALGTSVRLVRSFLPGAGVFLLLAIVITQGLDLLWTIPPSSSWLTAAGIFGHAFVYTSMLAASFVYYRGGLHWMQQVIEHLQNQSSVQA
jgi:hypothetical protein